MTIIAPTITTDQPAVYAQRLEQFLAFAPRIQIDITDGEFAPSQTINLNQLYWPPTDRRQAKIDLHLMMRRPIDWLDQIVSLAPDKVILQAESAEAATKLPQIFDHFRRFGIVPGLALLPKTQPAEVANLIKTTDDVLVFGGHLGYQGGKADLSQLDKIAAIKQINNRAVIEWDGGASVDNVKTIAAAGADQINVGSAISSSDNVRAAYDALVGLLADRS